MIMTPEPELYYNPFRKVWVVCIDDDGNFVNHLGEKTTRLDGEVSATYHSQDEAKIARTKYMIEQRIGSSNQVTKQLETMNTINENKKRVGLITLTDKYGNPFLFNPDKMIAAEPCDIPKSIVLGLKILCCSGDIITC